MIALTRMDGNEIVVNAEHILTVESMPDTLLLLSGGLKLMVKEPVEEVVERAVAYRRRTFHEPDVDCTVVPFRHPAGQE